jgi:hypothetical protein
MKGLFPIAPRVRRWQSYRGGLGLVEVYEIVVADVGLIPCLRGETWGTRGNAEILRCAQDDSRELGMTNLLLFWITLARFVRRVMGSSAPEGWAWS